MSIVGFTVKQPAETFPIAVNFAAELAAGETISTATVTARDAVSGSNTSSTILSGLAGISGAIVSQRVVAGASGEEHIIQFRIEDVLLNDDLKYFLSTPHRLDALTPPLESHLRRLEGSIKKLLN